jgi:hypothetical protein
VNESTGAAACPNCGTESLRLVRVEAGLKLRLQEDGTINPVPNEVCEDCLRSFARLVSKGAVLRAEAEAKEQNRLSLWRNRVNLVKQAKQLMAQKQYSDAAISYEKYLRILEIIYEKNPGGLTPETFKNSKKELTIIASVYWDLVRIYDVNPRYSDRQLLAAEKLADFARFTPVFPNILRKAEAQTRSAKNPAAFKRFLGLVNHKRARCFIATSAFDGQRTQEIEILCRFRDQLLKRQAWGRRFVWAYYKVSPAVAEYLDANPKLKPATRKVLSLLAKCVGKFA